MLRRAITGLKWPPLLVIAGISLLLTLLAYQPVHAQFNSGDGLATERGADLEQMRYDGDTIILIGGNYKSTEGIVFKKINSVDSQGRQTYRIDTAKTMNVEVEKGSEATAEAEEATQDCRSVPIALFHENKDKRAQKKPGIQIGVREKTGMAEFMLIADTTQESRSGEGDRQPTDSGTLLWWAKTDGDNIKKLLKNDTDDQKAAISDLSKYSLNSRYIYDKDDGDNDDGNEGWGHLGNLYKNASYSGGNLPKISDTFPTCKYNFYANANRFLAPYDDLRTDLEPLAGHIIGIAGMPFKEYTDRADNRLKFLAITQSAKKLTYQQCGSNSKRLECIRATYAAYELCYKKGIDSTTNPRSVIKDLKNDVWKKDLDEAKFVGCYDQTKQLVDEKFFVEEDEEQTDTGEAGDSPVPDPSKSEDDADTDTTTTGQDEEDRSLVTDTETSEGGSNVLNQFANDILSQTDLPPSLMPNAPEELSDAPVADSSTQCSIGMLGWILCPVLNFIASLNDTLFSLLSNWLVLEPYRATFEGSESSTYNSWSKARNLANIVFVVALMAMVYAQFSARFVLSHGVRKLLPRIVLTAFMVNISYFICSVVVDFSNTLGDSLYRLLASGVDIKNYSLWSDITIQATLLGGAAAGTFGVIGNLAALVPLLVMAFIALVTTYIVLLFRQAFLILFVVISPIAVALYAIPETAKWFAKWRQVFLQLLMIYPVFSLVFGGANMAADVVQGTAVQGDNFFLTLFSIAMRAIPFFTIPIIMKFGGGILNRIGGIVNDPKKGPFDRMKNRANEFKDDRKVRQQTRALRGNKGALGYGALIRRGQRTAAARDYHASTAARNKNRVAGRTAVNAAAGAFGSQETKQLAEDLLRQAQESAIHEQLHVRAVRAQEMPVSDGAAFDTAAGIGKNVSDIDQAAAINQVVSNGDTATIERLLNSLQAKGSNFTRLQRETLQKALAANPSIAREAPHLSQANIERVMTGRISSGPDMVRQMHQAAAADGAYSAIGIAQMSPDAIANLQSNLTDDQLNDVKRNFATAKADPKIRSRMRQDSFQAAERHLS